MVVNRVRDMLRTDSMRTRLAKALPVIGLWIPVFLAGMVVHESLHAVAVLVLGSSPVLVLRPWPMALAPFAITGIHIAPVPALDPARQAADNLLGPGVAAIVFAAVAAKIPRGSLRQAMIATVLGLAFFALIEPLDVVTDGRLEIGFLTAPEFNYGVPLLLALIVAAASTRGRRPSVDVDRPRRQSQTLADQR